MSQFKDLNEVLEPLVLPIGGKKYTIPAPSFEAGVKIGGVVDSTTNVAPEEFLRLLLSDALFEELISDKVSYAQIDRIARTALTDFRWGREYAVKMWETGGDPKAMTAYDQRNAPNRAARRSKSTGAARKTQ